MTDTPSRPAVSVVIEGYNDSRDIGCLEDTLAGLRAQTFPPSRVEVLFIGSPEQAEQWRPMAADPAPFASIRIVEAAGDHYYALKNRGSEHARAPILAFLDSDVVPEPGWLAAMVSAIEEGAQATCGPSLFRGGPGATYGLGMLAAASISWGFIYAHGGGAAGFLSHNLGIRRELFERCRYRTDLDRTCAGSFLMDTLREAGIRPRFLPAQRVAHAFQARWWITKLHVRFGHEVYLLHRMGSGAVSGAARWLGPLDAILTPAWHTLLDFPQWWRYSGMLGVAGPRRLAGFLALLPLSLLARGGEAAGMLATLAAPERMRLFAAEN